MKGMSMSQTAFSMTGEGLQGRVGSHLHRAMLQALCTFAAAHTEPWMQCTVLTELCSRFHLYLLLAR